MNILHPPYRGSSAHRQRGVYAIEFALVFLIFFALLYAIIGYGILFTFRFGLQNAAEDGARAGLRYQVVAGGGSQLQLRKEKAEAIATQRVAGWLPGTPTFRADICQISTANCTTPICGQVWEQRCQIVVTVTATGMNQVLPLLNFAMPDTLVGQASMLLDGRAL